MTLFVPGSFAVRSLSDKCAPETVLTGAWVGTTLEGPTGTDPGDRGTGKMYGCVRWEILVFTMVLHQETFYEKCYYFT